MVRYKDWTENEWKKKTQIKTLKYLLESLKNYCFKNDKKVWLLGSKILRNKQCLKSFCTVLYNASVVARHMPAGFVGWFEPQLFGSSRKRNIKLEKWNSEEKLQIRGWLSFMQTQFCTLALKHDHTIFICIVFRWLNRAKSAGHRHICSVLSTVLKSGVENLLYNFLAYVPSCRHADGIICRAGFHKSQIYVGFFLVLFIL